MLAAGRPPLCWSRAVGSWAVGSRACTRLALPQSPPVNVRPPLWLYACDPDVPVLCNNYNALYFLAMCHPPPGVRVLA